MMDWFQEFGKGKRGKRALSYDEAGRAAGSILDGYATPAQTAAFLMAQYIKPESSPELSAFINALRSRSHLQPMPGSLDFAGTLEARSRSFLAALPAAFVLCACRLPVALTSSMPLPAPVDRDRIPLDDIFTAWGIEVDALSRDDWTRGALAGGPLYVRIEQWCPPLARLLPLRKELGIRTVFHTAERLLRIADSASVAYGVASPHAFDKTAELLRTIGIHRALLTPGAEGSDDVHTDRRTRIYLMHDGLTDLHIIDPQTFGLFAPQPEGAWTAGLQAQAALDVLQGRSGDALRKAVILNSALRLWAAERTESIGEGIEHAKFALDQGGAWKYYLKWRSAIGSPAT